MGGQDGPAGHFQVKRTRCWAHLHGTGTLLHLSAMRCYRSWSWDAWVRAQRRCMASIPTGTTLYAGFWRRSFREGCLLAGQVAMSIACFYPVAFQPQTSSWAWSSKEWPTSALPPLWTIVLWHSGKQAVVRPGQLNCWRNTLQGSLVLCPFVQTPSLLPRRATRRLVRWGENPVVWF